MRFLLCLLLLFTGMGIQAQVPDSVFVTSWHPSLTKQSFRLQLSPRSSSLEVHAINVKKFPSSLRKLKSGTSPKLTYQDLISRGTRSLDSIYSWNLAIQPDLGFELPSTKTYSRYKTFFLEGKKTAPYIQHQWINLGKLDNTGEPVKIKGYFKTNGLYSGAQLPYLELPHLPVLDYALCVPITLRYFTLRKLSGYGIDHFIYTPYEYTSRQNIRKEFELFFERGETKPDQVGVEKIKNYLESNEYVIRHAKLEGGYSPEGDSLANKRLQLRRAKELQKILHRYNEQTIEQDTLILNGPYELFRKSIHTTNLSWLDTLSNSNINKLLNTNPSLLQQAEPYLSRLRTAKLSLVMVRRFSMDEHLEDVERTLIQQQNLLFTREGINKQTEQKLMGIIAHLFQLYTRGEISKENLRSLLDRQPRKNEVYLLTGYHILKQYHDGKWFNHKNLTWAAYWDRYEIHSWFRRCERAAIEALSASQGTVHESRHFKILIDYQNFRYKFILEKLITSIAICEVPYPDERIFESLKLHYYAFLYHLEAEWGTDDLCSDYIPASISKKRYRPNPDSLVAVLDEEMMKSGIPVKIGKVIYQPKTYYKGTKSPYYTLLVNYFHRNNKTILRYYESADDKAMPEGLNEFNLLHLVQISLEGWNPEENSWYDRDIGLVELHSLVNKLQAIGGSICPQDLNEVLLTYYHKSLRYLSRYQEGGNEAHSKIANASLKFISNYYRNRTKYMNPRLAVYLAWQLNAYNWLPGTHCGAYYGAGILQPASKTTQLDESGLWLLEQYKFLFGSRSKKQKQKEIADQLDLRF